MAAKLTLPLSQWRRQSPARQDLMRAALQRIAAVGRSSPTSAGPDSTSTRRSGDMQSSSAEDDDEDDQHILSADTYEIVHRSLQP